MTVYLSPRRRLSGKVAIVSGGGTGFGRAITEHFIEEGAAVVIVDISNKMSGELDSKYPGKTAFVTGDVSKRDTWTEALNCAITSFGQLDILVNNAGISRNSAAHLLEESQLDLMMNIHLKAIFHSVQVTFPHFLQHGNGCVINIASTGATRPRPGFTWYNMTKGGVMVATKSLAVEYAPKIRCNAIVPALGNTSMLLESFGGRQPSQSELSGALQMIPMKRITQPSDVAKAAVYLASDDASFVTGTCLDVDGGRGI